jgi:hypothetical protein
VQEKATGGKAYHRHAMPEWDSPKRIATSWSQILAPRDRNIVLVSLAELKQNGKKNVAEDAE